MYVNRVMLGLCVFFFSRSSPLAGARALVPFAAAHPRTKLYELPNVVMLGGRAAHLDFYTPKGDRVATRSSCTIDQALYTHHRALGQLLEELASVAVQVAVLAVRYGDGV